MGALLNISAQLVQPRSFGLIRQRQLNGQIGLLASIW
jgi:hypothetical protein